MQLRLQYVALAKRLALGGTLIALLLGGLVMYVQTERVDEDFVELAFTQIKDAVEKEPAFKAPATPDRDEKIYAVLNNLVNASVPYADGDFVVAEYYDVDHNLVSESIEAGFSHEAVIDKRPHLFPKNNIVDYEKYFIDGKFYLLVLSPMNDGSGHRVGYLEGVFRVSPRAVEEVKHNALISTVIAILAVIGATVLLYPVVLQLDRRLLGRTKDLVESNLATLRVLGNAIAKRDSDTGDHNYRVTLVSVQIAEAAGLSKHDIRTLIKGAFLHDVGKIAISDMILLKPGRLNQEEFEIMKSHVRHGLEIVGDVRWLSEAVDVVHYHHEKYDGRGYPQGLAAEQIPVTARVFAIADVFDALTSERPYKKAMPLAQALEIMIGERGKHFDPALLDLFVVMAQSLHEEFSSRTEPQLAALLEAVSNAYFRDALDD